MDDAADVGAHRRAFDHGAIVAAERRNFRCAAADDRSLARRELVDRADLAAGQIFGQVGDVLGAAFYEFAEAGSGDRLAPRVEQLGEMGLLFEQQGGEVERSGDAVGDALAAVPGVDVDVAVARVAGPE